MTHTPCAICNHSIRNNNIARHILVCKGRGPYKPLSVPAPVNDMYECPKCARSFSTPQGYGHHKCSTKRQYRTNLSDYPYTPVWSKICRQSQRTFFTVKPGMLYHPEAQIALRTYRARAAFDFNVYQYPDRFDLRMIQEYGWYSPGGRNGNNKNRNMTGVSRDHLYPVKLGWLNNIDPELLAHPANCQLMLQMDNLKKRDNASISINELKERIKHWR